MSSIPRSSHDTMLKMFLFPVVVISSILIFSSCDGDYYSYRKEIPDGNWPYGLILDFPFEINDTSHQFDLLIDVEHAVSFANSNLYVKIGTWFPNGEAKNDIVSFNLANRFGIWEGRCGSDHCVAEILLQKSVSFKDIGIYRIDLEQYSREEVVRGIKSLTLRLKQVK